MRFHPSNFFTVSKHLKRTIARRRATSATLSTATAENLVVSNHDGSTQETPRPLQVISTEMGFCLFFLFSYLLEMHVLIFTIWSEFWYKIVFIFVDFVVFWNLVVNMCRNEINMSACSGRRGELCTLGRIDFLLWV